MINTDEIIIDLKNRFENLISNNTLNGVCEESSSNSVSFYIYKSPEESTPMLILRISDHRPYLQKMIRGENVRPSSDENTNLSIEFYKPQFTANGNRKKNRFNNKVQIPDNIPELQPFTMSSFSYSANKLEIQDIEVIYGSLLIWLFRTNGNAAFQDPFVGTEKEAKAETKTTEITITTRTSQNIAIDKNGDYIRANGDGADLVSERLNTMELYTWLCEQMETRKGA